MPLFVSTDLTLDPLLVVEAYAKRFQQKRILLTIQAMERFVLYAEIAMGLVQLISLKPVFTKQVESHRYPRGKGL